MKKLIIILLTLLFCMSCATLFPGNSRNKLKPKKNKKPKKKSYQVVLMQPAETVEYVSFYE